MKKYLLYIFFLILGICLFAEKKESNKIDAIMYKGKWRTSKWIQDRYFLYKKRLVLVNSEYFDLGNPEFYMCKNINGKVFQVPGPTSILFTKYQNEYVRDPYRDHWVQGYTDDLGKYHGGHWVNAYKWEWIEKDLIHIEGVNAKNIHDGQWLGPFNAQYIGTYKYTNVLQSEKTVRNYYLYSEKSPGLKFEEFIDILNLDYSLLWYKKFTENRNVVWKPFPNYD